MLYTGGVHPLFNLFFPGPSGSGLVLSTYYGPKPSQGNSLVGFQWGDPSWLNWYLLTFLYNPSAGLTPMDLILPLGHKFNFQETFPYSS